VVGTGGIYLSENALCIDIDSEAGILLALEHLRSRGYQRIVHLAGTPNIHSVAVRRHSYESQMQQWGMPCEVIGDSFEAEQVCASIRQWLESAEFPCAILAGNDDLALIALRMIREQGLRIPEDIAIVGFDDCPMAEHCSPSLTTIRQPIREIGEAIVQALVDRIEDKSTVADTVVKRFEPTLIVRGST
jgi:DNA-binding LacI/PurR family transcriptional regulator